MEKALQGISAITTDSPGLQNSTCPRRPKGNGDDDPTIPLFKGVYLSSRYGCLQDMWTEWFGLLSHLSKPIHRGFAKMEELYKAKWRGHFDAAQKRRFSRIKLIVGGLQAKMDADSRDDSTVLAEYDEMYRSKAMRRSIGALLKKLQEEGLVKKQKTRGRHVQASN